MCHRIRENSIEGKKNVFKNHILPYFKDKPVNVITPADIRTWQNNLICKGYSDAYLDRIQTMLTTIMNYAVRYYNLPANPCDKAGKMGKRTRSQKFWTLEEFNQIIGSVSDITANDVADYIRLVDYSDDETNTLNNLIGIAKTFIMNYTGHTLEELDNYQDFVIVVLILCQDMWDNRTLYVDKSNLNKVVETILNMHCNNLLPTVDAND